MENPNPNPNPRNDDDDGETDADGWNLSNDVKPAPGEGWMRLLIELNRRASSSLAKLNAPERFIKLNELAMKYRKSDEERQADRIREFISQNYTSGAEEVCDTESHRFLLVSFREALETNTPASIRNILIPVAADGVYKFKMMLRDPCRMISYKIRTFRKWCSDNGCRPSPPVLYEHSIVVEYPAFQMFIDKLFKQCLEPVVKACFDHVGEVDSLFSFSVTLGLENGTHSHIDPNYGDESDVTIKLCISDIDSTGAELVFGERRCAGHETTRAEPSPEEVKVEMGEVVMHCGRHRNGFTPIEQFTKEYLVIWCKSSLFGEMNRYKTEFPESCIICQGLRKEREERTKAEMVNAISSFDPRTLTGESPSKKPKLVDG